MGVRFSSRRLRKHPLTPQSLSLPFLPLYAEERQVTNGQEYQKHMPAAIRIIRYWQELFVGVELRHSEKSCLMASSVPPAPD